MGGKSSKPDNSMAIAAAQQNAYVGRELGLAQIDESRRQFDINQPLLTGIANDQATMMRQQMAQAKEYYDYQIGTYRPVEQKMVADAMAFNTEAKREELAQQAAADAGLAFAQTQAGSERAMASMGVNPNSGRFAGQQRASELGLAAQKANAMTGTRRMAEAEGQARLSNAVGLGKGLANASSAAYQGAGVMGNSAGGNYQSAGQNYLAGMNQGAGTWMGGLGAASQGFNSIYGTQMGLYGQQQGAMTDMIGTGLGIAGGVAML